MNLRSDECETCDGHIIDPYYVIDCMDWVHIVPFDHEGRLLVTRQYRHGNADIQWEIPGGCIDADDPSPLVAAKRELLEETGCMAEHYTELPRIFANPARQSNRVYAFRASGVTMEADPKFDATEVIQYEFIPVEEAMDRIRNGQFQNSLLIASLMMALSNQFH